MESAGALCEMPSFEDLRRGQSAVVKKFQEMTSEEFYPVVAKLPTGYGKTKAAAASFAFLKLSGKVDFMLFVVPRTAQSDQCGESVPEELSRYGIDTKSFDFGDSPTKAHRAVKNNLACVFVITIQSLISKSTQDALKSAMSIGRWLIVIDEYHHYAMDGKWTEWIKSLPATCGLAMSATPDREDCPSPFGSPEISVTYREAVRDGAVKPLSLHSYDYKINAVKQDGQVISFSISELQAEVTDSILVENVIAARRARWQPDFISPIILEPIDRLNDLAMYGIRSQMIVQAIDCSHAAFVCEQIREILSDGMTVDWVGTGARGRTPEENQKILNAFCPPKNEFGIRNWTLDILVNVGMAGEGLDTTDVTEVVFLTNPRGTISDRQVMGRAARMMRVDDIHRKKIIGHINVDSGCDLSKFVGSKIMDVFDSTSEYVEDDAPTEEDVETETAGENNSIKKIDWENLLMVLSVELIDIKHDPEYVPIRNKIVDGLSERFSQEDAEIAAKKILDEYLTDKAKKNQSRNQSINDQNNRNQVHEVTKNISRKIAHLMSIKYKMQFDKKLCGLVRERINRDKARKCGNIANCTGDELQKHIDYLKSLEADLLEGVVPQCALQG